MTRKVPPRSLDGSARMAVVAIVASIAMGTLLAGPAAGAENKNDLLQLSRDGVHFATDAIPTMFRSTKGYVPGESRPGLIWVRNAGKDSAHFTLAVHNTNNPDTSAGIAGASILPQHLRLQAQASGRVTTANALPTPGTCTPVIDGWTLAAGEVLPLTLDLGLSVEAPNSTRNQNADFTLTFVLQERGAGQLIGPCAGGPGNLAAGGAVISLPISGGTAATRTPATGVVSGGVQVPIGSDVGTDLDPLQQGVQPSPEASQALPLLRQLQSNVEATDYNPWPWIVVISACVYVFTSVRKRSKTR
ncbi:hypothetical protein [Arthrobacter glacialis]|uniref:Peptidase n=1 Tax=Arthrobacter glacialis TaxID=1664 RepID=A0A2S4A0V2_ARTGL|nr:hypothetical protein [Arthrobacter glacialis]POH74919.1 hypothetical protein CVS27_03400 [Arthrobacter glacialis]